jgi:hypothetical protein
MTLGASFDKLRMTLGASFDKLKMTLTKLRMTLTKLRNDRSEVPPSVTLSLSKGAPPSWRYAYVTDFTVSLRSPAGRCQTT